MKWETAKKLLDKESAKYSQIISSYESAMPNTVLRKKHGKTERVEVIMPEINGYPVSLIVYQNNKDGVKTAFYAMFNNESNIVYKRDLLEI